VIGKLCEALSFRGWKLQRRTDYSAARGVLFKILAVILALLITGIVIQASGESALAMGKRVLESTLGSNYGLQQWLVLATPLMLTGAALLIGTRMLAFNFGLEGQLFVGAWAAAAIGLHLNAPPWLAFILMFVGGALAGALLAFVPAIMRIKAGISEILTTLLLNFVAIQFTLYFAMDAWRDWGTAVNLGATTPIPYVLPALWGHLHIGILIAVFLVVGSYLALEGTVWGYEVTSIGANRTTAEFAGIAVTKHMLVIMLLSGAFAGVSGVIELTGVAHRLSAAVSAGYGWTGINVAILAGNSPLAIIPWGLFLALILNAGFVLQAQGLSVNVVLAVTGLILLLVSVGEIVANYSLVRISQLERAEDVGAGPEEPLAHSRKAARD
jgi:ABC-type uncharacterized transport system permease subunit